MEVLIHLRLRVYLVGLFALVSTFAAGCRETEQIHSYAARKETKPAAKESAPTASPGEPTDRMLAAILPASGQAYFFKVVGPIAAIDKHEKELNDFFAKIRFSDDEKAKWQLPIGWKEEVGNGMRLATIVIPTDGKPLEVTVTALPWSGTPDDMLRNVNRWRGQLQLPPVEAGKLAESTREMKAGDGPMTIVDLRGRFAGASMTPPFPGAPVNAASRAAPNVRPSGLPPGHPPITPPNAAAPHTEPPAAATNDVPKFAAPSEWKALPADGIRKAAFAIGDAEHGALLTLTSFPAKEGPMIADPLQNVNRWRREVGLPDLNLDGLAKSTESMEVDGKPTTYVRAIPDAAQADQSQASLATLAAMVNADDQIWFIKLKGERSVVAAQEVAFKNFLKSVRFAADGGATDGHK